MSGPGGAGRGRSLAGALFRNIVLLTLVVVAAVAAGSLLSARREVDRAYDAQLVVGSQVLYALMGEELAHHHDMGAPGEAMEVDDGLLSEEDRRAFDVFADWRMFRIWRGGRLVLRSDTGPVETAPPARTGFREQPDGTSPWRIHSFVDARRGLATEVGERRAVRRVVVARMALGLAPPLLLTIPAVALLAWLSVRGGLQALRRVVDALAERSERDLSRLDVGAAPREMRPLVGILDRLLARTARALDQERRFTDQAAHQLRTPMAAIKLGLQTAQRETDPLRRDRLIAQALGAAERASRLSEQLLMLARLEADVVGAGPCDLTACAAEVLAVHFAAAEARTVRLALSAPDHAPAAADAAQAELILANFLENALKHAPADSEVEVSVEAHAGGWRVSVCDAGPGVAEGERERLFEPFEQGPGETGGGLGLALVREAVRALGGTAGLDDNAAGAGLCAWAWLPASPVDAPAHMSQV